ncbi:winged helix-turn-helix domain-containing protein [Deinococcus malanensis]|uniref:winged helix-turn-helix domain-containing protein n=1 Tax=Deinococcus malanensis TaxID=1706855 RepID=UPI0036310035
MSPNSPQTPGLSFLNAAARVLEVYANRQPMHYRAITEVAVREGWVQSRGQTPEATLYAQVLQDISRHERRITQVAGVQPRAVPGALQGDRLPFPAPYEGAAGGVRMHRHDPGVGSCPKSWGRYRRCGR